MRQPLDDDTLSRLKGDYRRTLAKLHLDYVNAWVTWAHEEGFKARNQAHGAPGNLLDLYGAADIPETESFGLTELPIVGLRGDAVGVSIDPDPPSVTIGRFASSAAHVMGKPLVSSETLTWLRENFRESPAAAKPQLDRLFAAGINHIFYHGTVYSPADAEWPGWFFYASTQLTPSNPLWDDFGAMHAYVARVQSVLQAGAPDNDILLYWPFDDVVEHSAGLMEHYGVHENKWLTEAPAGRMAAKLLQAGYAFDFVSDAQLHAPDRERRCDRRAGRPLPLHRGPRHAPHVGGDADAVARAHRSKGRAVVSLRIPAAGCPRLRGIWKRAAPSCARCSRLRHCAPQWPEKICGARVRCAQEQAPQAGLAHIRRARADGSRLLLRQPHGQGIRRLAAARYAGRVRDDPGSADRPHRNGGREARGQGKSAGLSTARVRRIHAGAHLAREGHRTRHNPGVTRSPLPRASHCRASGVSSSSREGRCCRVPHA